MNSVAVFKHPANGHAAAKFASITVPECFEQLVTSPGGLISAEAKARLVWFGRNTFPRARRTSWWIALGSNFVHLFAILLWLAALLSWLAGMPELTLAISLVVVVNGLFSYRQQYRAQQAVDALESLLPRRVTVRRGGAELVIDAADVAVGDILVLGEGTAIPADARLILVALIYLPPLSGVFHLLPLQPQHWLLAASFPLCILFCEEARKLLVRCRFPDAH